MNNKYLSAAIIMLFIASGFAALCVTGSNATTVSDGENVAIYDASGTEVGKYDTLIDALKDVEDNQTVKLLNDIDGVGVGFFDSGDGIAIWDNGTKVPMHTKDVTIDFNGKTYTVVGSLVGSSKTMTQAMHLESNLTITLENGTFTSTEESGAKMLVQNYCNAHFVNFTMDGRNLKSDASRYVLSNNNGSVVFSGASNIFAVENSALPQFAFDLCHFMTYGDVTVTFDETFKGIINGNVEMSEGGFKTEPEKRNLSLINEGDLTFNGAFACTLMNNDKTDASFETKNAIESGGNGTTIQITPNMSAKFGGDIGIGVCIGLGIGAKMELTDDLVFEGGAMFVHSENPSIETTGGSHDITMMVGAMEAVGAEKLIIYEHESYRKYDQGGKSVEVFRATFVVAQHVKEFKYNDQPGNYADFIVGDKMTLDLSKLQVSCEDGYHVSGFIVKSVKYINGMGIETVEWHSTSDCITVSQSCEITPVVEPNGSSENVALIVAICIMLIIIVVALFWMHKSWTK